jgi:hypothetical protein
MNWLNHFYEELWYHVESLWEKNKWARRPFTFIFHDFSHAHPIIYWLLHAIVIGVGSWLISPWIILFCFIWFVNGHVVWGGHSINEQENPPYWEL